MIKFKPGVDASGVRAETWDAIRTAERLWQDAGQALTVTSLRDGEHCDEAQGRPCPDGRPHSLHYDGLAVDFRTRDLPSHQVQAFADELRRRLGWPYQVVVESMHLHVEFDLRGGIA